MSSLETSFTLRPVESGTLSTNGIRNQPSTFAHSILFQNSIQCIHQEATSYECNEDARDDSLSPMGTIDNLGWTFRRTIRVSPFEPLVHHRNMNDGSISTRHVSRYFQKEESSFNIYGGDEENVNGYILGNTRKRISTIMEQNHQTKFQQTPTFQEPQQSKRSKSKYLAAVTNNSSGEIYKGSYEMYPETNPFPTKKCRDEKQSFDSIYYGSFICEGENSDDFSDISYDEEYDEEYSILESDSPTPISLTSVLHEEAQFKESILSTEEEFDDNPRDISSTCSSYDISSTYSSYINNYSWTTGQNFKKQGVVDSTESKIATQVFPEQNKTNRGSEKVFGGKGFFFGHSSTLHFKDQVDKENSQRPESRQDHDIPKMELSMSKPGLDTRDGSCREQSSNQDAKLGLIRSDENSVQRMERHKTDVSSNFSKIMLKNADSTFQYSQRILDLESSSEVGGAQVVLTENENTKNFVLHENRDAFVTEFPQCAHREDSVCPKEIFRKNPVSPRRPAYAHSPGQSEKREAPSSSAGFDKDDSLVANTRDSVQDRSTVTSAVKSGNGESRVLTRSMAKKILSKKIVL